MIFSCPASLASSRYLLVPHGVSFEIPICLTFPDFTSVDIASSVSSIEIPTSLENSLIRFENSKILKEYFGENYLKLYSSVKRGEENLYNSTFIPKEEYDYYL